MTRSHTVLSADLAAGLSRVDVREDVILTAPTTMLEQFPSRRPSPRTLFVKDGGTMVTMVGRDVVRQQLPTGDGQ